MDIALMWNSEEMTADVQVLGADLVTTDDIETAVIISLFTDRRAPDDIELPEGADRGGWWGDSYPDVEGDELGSLLWLLKREMQTPGTLERARKYAREALDWMIADEVARQVTVVATYPERGWMLLSIEILLATGERRTLVYRLNPEGSTSPFEALPGLPGEIRGTGGPGAIEAASWAPPAAALPGELRGTGGPAAIEASAWSPAAAAKFGEVQGASGVPAIEADAWAPEPAGKPGEGKGSSGVPAIVADAWSPDPAGTPGEAQGTSGVPPIEADAWTPDPTGKPGEAKGTSGVAAIQADPWQADALGLQGEIKCGQILSRDFLTADNTLLSADDDEITADAEF